MTTPVRTPNTAASRRTRQASPSIRRAVGTSSAGRTTTASAGRRQGSMPRATAASTGTTAGFRSRRCRTGTTSTVAAIRRSCTTAAESPTTRTSTSTEPTTPTVSSSAARRTAASRGAVPAWCSPTPLRAAVPATRANLVTARWPSRRRTRRRPRSGASANFSVTFNDKEYIAAGPRPAGVDPHRFKPVSKAPMNPGDPGCPTANIGPDRIYVTWSRFTNPAGTPGFITDSKIVMSYSDDRGHSWSAQQVINGSAPFCAFSFAGGTACDDNQFSVPTVSPSTGHLYVAFENFNTRGREPVARRLSKDGGATFEGPFFVTPTFDVNLRLKADCIARGANRVHLTNSCFRVPMTGAIAADKRGGNFADDLDLVMEDNRNGTRDSTNSDVFLFKSLDGGSNWHRPDSCEQRRVRCSGKPRLWPYRPARVSGRSEHRQRPVLAVARHQRGRRPEHCVQGPPPRRRLDGQRMADEPRAAGNYLVWTWGAQLRGQARARRVSASLRPRR